MQRPFKSPVIAGALFDLLGWLTTRMVPTSDGDKIMLDSPQVAQILVEWATERGLLLDNPLIDSWVKEARMFSPTEPYGAPKEYKTLAPFLDGEPTFTIRAKDLYSVSALLQLQKLYNIHPNVLRWFAEWQAANPQHVKVPD